MDSDKDIAEKIAKMMEHRQTFRTLQDNIDMIVESFNRDAAEQAQALKLENRTLRQAGAKLCNDITAAAQLASNDTDAIINMMLKMGYAVGEYIKSTASSPSSPAPADTAGAGCTSPSAEPSPDLPAGLPELGP